jgi:hypothetical protein
MFKKKVLRKILGPKSETGENFIMRSFVICACHEILFG